MSVITMPRTLACARGCRIEQITSDAISASDPAGTTQARSYGLPRWAMSLVSPAALTEAAAGEWKAMLLALRGSINHLAAFDPARPTPKGTLRGALTLQSSAAAGDVSCSVTGGAGQAGRTLVVGDWLQLGTGLGSSQLVMVVAATAADGSGVAAVSFEPPLRLDLPAGTPVTWDHPVAYFRRAPGRVSFGQHTWRLAAAMSVDLVESW